MKIYTKTGDKGTTSLANGGRVPKDHPQIEAYGCIDELNAHLGALHSITKDQTLQRYLTEVQSSLFFIGSQLAGCAPCSLTNANLSEHTDFIEKIIDSWEKELTPLTKFILPGGCREASSAHLCRTICRRAERLVTRLDPEAYSRPLQFLNRLSDMFFVLARIFNTRSMIEETPWDAKETRTFTQLK